MRSNVPPFLQRLQLTFQGQAVATLFEVFNLCNAKRYLEAALRIDQFLPECIRMYHHYEEFIKADKANEAFIRDTAQKQLLMVINGLLDVRYDFSAEFELAPYLVAYEANSAVN